MTNHKNFFEANSVNLDIASKAPEQPPTTTYPWSRTTKMATAK